MFIFFCGKRDTLNIFRILQGQAGALSVERLFVLWENRLGGAAADGLEM
jgi:hypothetical protein